MGSQYDKRTGYSKKGLTPEQGSLLIVMIGFLIMASGIYLTKDILNIYFDIGIVIVILGTALYTLFIYARIYSIEHIPIPLPEMVRDFLMSSINRQVTTQRPGPSYAPGHERAITRTAPVYQAPTYVDSNVGSGTPPAPAISAPAPTPAPSPVQRPVTQIPTTPVKPPTYEVETPSPTPVSTPIPAAVTPSPKPAAVPQPKPPKEKYIDVLEEADKEFESYIDKLIEE